jgi:hypothetical protein
MIKLKKIMTEKKNGMNLYYKSLAGTFQINGKYTSIYWTGNVWMVIYGDDFFVSGKDAEKILGEIWQIYKSKEHMRAYDAIKIWMDKNVEKK